MSERKGTWFSGTVSDREYSTRLTGSQGRDISAPSAALMKILHGKRSSAEGLISEGTHLTINGLQHYTMTDSTSRISIFSAGKSFFNQLDLGMKAVTLNGGRAKTAEAG